MINSETHIIIELPFGNQVPTQAEILKRFKRLYVENKPLLPLLTTCAEESEAMMHELFSGTSKGGVTIRRTRTAKGYLMKGGYFCPSCKKGGINAKFKFCPNCGKSINWNR